MRIYFYFSIPGTGIITSLSCGKGIGFKISGLVRSDRTVQKTVADISFWQIEISNEEAIYAVVLTGNVKQIYSRAPQCVKRIQFCIRIIVGSTQFMRTTVPVFYINQAQRPETIIEKPVAHVKHQLIVFIRLPQAIIHPLCKGIHMKFRLGFLEPEIDGSTKYIGILIRSTGFGDFYACEHILRNHAQIGTAIRRIRSSQSHPIHGNGIILR